MFCIRFNVYARSHRDARMVAGWDAGPAAELESAA